MGTPAVHPGLGYWNPLRQNLLAGQHLADTPQLPALATWLAAGHDWEARVLTQLLAELTRATPDQRAVQAALDELIAAATRLAEQPVGPAGRPGAAGGRAGRDPRGRRASTGCWPLGGPMPTAPVWKIVAGCRLGYCKDGEDLSDASLRGAEG